MELEPWTEAADATGEHCGLNWKEGQRDRGTHHVRQANVSQAADQRSTQARQLHEEGLILLLNHLVLVLNAL